MHVLVTKSEVFFKISALTYVNTMLMLIISQAKRKQHNITSMKDIVQPIAKLASTAHTARRRCVTNIR